MANFKFDSQEELLRLIARAQSLKPTVANVVAHEKGWVVPHNNGYLETLVSFRGLDELLGLPVEEVSDGNPVEVKVEHEQPDNAENPPVEELPKDVVPEGKKKSGRPKKAE